MKLSHTMWGHPGRPGHSERYFSNIYKLKHFRKKIFILPTDTLSLIFYFNLSHIYASLHPYACPSSYYS